MEKNQHVKYFGQFSPPVDKFIHDNYFKNKSNGVCIEAGAHDGIRNSSCYFFEKYKNWSCINIEPAPYLFNLLKDNRPNSINLNVALSDRKGRTTFKHVIHPILRRHFGNGSIQHEKSHMEKLKSIGCTFEDVEVETITYIDLMDKLNPKNVDLFVLDIEGYELNVIKEMVKANKKFLPSILCIEFPHVGLGALKENLKSIYKLDKISHSNAYFVLL